MPHLTLSQKEKIVTRRCDGVSTAQIAIEENIPERTVRHVFQQWKKNGTKRELGRVVRANRRAPLNEIRQLISTKASEKTIHGELRKLDFTSRVAVKKPLLNAKQQKARYIFAKNHAHWAVDD
ncbi:hypothetical protein RMATCC62417_02247 [Rhizopus microsporus]|nr:hypothetical protein RMATCC62417_02247 [Rhizopus microsporus]